MSRFFSPLILTLILSSTAAMAAPAATRIPSLSGWDIVRTQVEPDIRKMKYHSWCIEAVPASLPHSKSKAWEEQREVGNTEGCIWLSERKDRSSFSIAITYLGRTRFGLQIDAKGPFSMNGVEGSPVTSNGQLATSVASEILDRYHQIVYLEKESVKTACSSYAFPLPHLAKDPRHLDQLSETYRQMICDATLKLVYLPSY